MQVTGSSASERSVARNQVQAGVQKTARGSSCCRFAVDWQDGGVAKWRMRPEWPDHSERYQDITQAALVGPLAVVAARIKPFKWFIDNLENQD